MLIGCPRCSTPPTFFLEWVWLISCSFFSLSTPPFLSVQLCVPVSERERGNMQSTQSTQADYRKTCFPNIFTSAFPKVFFRFQWWTIKLEGFTRGADRSNLDKRATRSLAQTHTSGFGAWDGGYFWSTEGNWPNYKLFFFFDFQICCLPLLTFWREFALMFVCFFKKTLQIILKWKK